MNFMNLILSTVSSLFLSAFAYAQATPASAPVAGAASAAASGAQQAPSFAMSIFPFLLMFGVVYFLMIRPQQKKMKDQQAMINALAHGDEILTSSGILGKITGIADKVVTVEVADNVRVKMLKNQVSQVIKGQIKDLA